MNLLRQLEIVPSDLLAATEVTVVGLGEVGSATALILAKMGVGKIVICDDKRVLATDIASQLYCAGDVGHLRVEALSELIGRYADPTVRTSTTVPAITEGVVLFAETTDEWRQKIWNDSVKLNPNVPMLLDVRVEGSGESRITAIRPFDADDFLWYEDSLGERRVLSGVRPPVSLTFDLAAECALAVKRLLKSDLMNRVTKRAIESAFDSEALSNLEVTLIGAGGIGSPTALALVKAGVRKLTVYDHDIIEDHNLPNQWYRLGDRGRPKVEALAEIIRNATGVEIIPRFERFERQHVRGVVITGVDSMDARHDLWYGALKDATEVTHIIDGRTGGEQFFVFSMNPRNPEDVAWYEDRIYRSDNPRTAEAPCSARAIIYTLFAIAGEIAKNVGQIAVGKNPIREVVRDLPCATRILDGDFDV